MISVLWVARILQVEDEAQPFIYAMKEERRQRTDVLEKEPFV
jgi:hypothetical protein